MELSSSTVKAFKLDDEIEDEIEDLILRDIDVNSHITGDKLGKCLKRMMMLWVFMSVTSLAPLTTSLDGMIKLVLDCANGASYKAAELVYQSLERKFQSLETSRTD